MNRRDFLQSAAILSASLAVPQAERLFSEDAAFSGWRTFDVTAHVEVLKPSGLTRVWLPAALINSTPFQRTLGNRFSAEGGTAHMIEVKADALGIITAEFPAGIQPVLTLTSRISTKNCAADFSNSRAASGTAANESRAALQHFLRPTRPHGYIPG